MARDTINRVMFGSPAWQDALIGRLTMNEFWYAIGPELGLASPAAVDQFRRRYYCDESPNTDVLDIIRRLHRSYRLAVLSNHPPGLNQWLQEWKIRNLFHVVFCSGDEGRLKPDPAVYHSTIARLEVEPTEAVFIDDTAEHVTAARSLGIPGIVFTNARQLEADLDALLDHPASKNRFKGLHT